MSLSAEESNAITWLRVYAMFSIVVCHLFQAYEVYLCSSIFNVGVQVFFLLSGFLYADKTIISWSNWWKRKWIKLYIPYILCLFLSLCYLFIIRGKPCSAVALVAHLLNLQGWRQVFRINSFLIAGLQHFWFMTAIMASYCILYLSRGYPLHTHNIQRTQSKDTLCSLPLTTLLVRGLCIFTREIPIRIRVIVAIRFRVCLCTNVNRTSDPRCFNQLRCLAALSCFHL